jgi:hypothetical protein
VCVRACVCGLHPVHSLVRDGPWLWSCLLPLCVAARRLWKSYFPSVDAVVYLIDANDKERFPEARKELDVRDRVLSPVPHRFCCFCCACWPCVRVCAWGCVCVFCVRAQPIAVLI